MLLVVLQVPPLNLETIKAVGNATGLAPAEIRQKLTGPPPRVLRMDADADKLQHMCNALTGLGLPALICDNQMAEGDGERLMARTLDFGADGFSAEFDTSGQTVFCPYTAIELIQRGAREHDETTVTTQVQRKFSPGRAMMGVGMSKKKKVDFVKREHKSERFVAVHRSDGQPDIMIYERRLHYEFLGTSKQAASFANLEATFKLLQAHAPAAPVDLTVAQKGFVQSLPQTRTDKVDLGLFLVRMKKRALAAWS